MPTTIVNAKATARPSAAVPGTPTVGPAGATSPSRLGEVHRHDDPQVEERGDHGREHGDDGERVGLGVDGGLDHVELGDEAGGERHAGLGEQEHGEREREQRARRRESPRKSSRVVAAVARAGRRAATTPNAPSTMNV